MKENENVERTKSLNGLITIKALEENDQYIIKGYLSTFNNTDRVGDVILEGAFDESVKNESVVTMLFNHNRDDVIGFMELSTDSKGLFVKGYFDKDDQKSMEKYQQVKFGSLRKMSIGMRIKEYELLDPKQPYGGWEISKAEVLEGSIVSVPANNEASINEVKTYISTKTNEQIEIDEKEQIEKEEKEKQIQATELANELRKKLEVN